MAGCYDAARRFIRCHTAQNRSRALHHCLHPTARHYKSRIAFVGGRVRILEFQASSNAC